MKYLRSIICLSFYHAIALAGHGAENFSLLKRCVLNLVKADTTEKASITLKRRMAGWDVAYRLKLLGVK